MKKWFVLAVAGVILSACGPEVSYTPEVASVTQSGVIYYNLNCQKGQLAACNAVAETQCSGVERNVRVTNHFVMGSEVQRLTFYCTTGRQQLVPENITFDDGTVVR